MARYGLVWLKIVLKQYASIPAEVQEQIDARVDQLLEKPRQSGAGYDKRADQ
jgi:mRNA-degrading endonuclease RelE of RelBE toxin-antitoxin system